MRWFGRPDREYREELEAHIQIEVRENIERGMTPDEARQAALRTFGNALAVRENLSVGRPLYLWQNVYRDIRYGLRLLKRSPGLTATVVITLALGIGANTAIFSLVNAVLLQMLPVQDPASLVIVRALTRQGSSQDWLPHTDYLWLRDHNQVFSGLAASMMFTENLYRGDHKERVTFEFVSGNYFSVLGVQPVAGRMITPEDDVQSRQVAVISYAYWQRAYAGRADALGKLMQVEKASLEIVGVAPPPFNGEYRFGGDPPAFWTPLTQQPKATNGSQSFLNTRNISWLGAIGRLRPGVSLAQARASMRPLVNALRADLHVDAQNDYLGGVGIEPGGGGLSGTRDQYGKALQLLMALVAVVLLIACANVANLLLARSAARRREFAVRLAIGAGRARLVRQLLTESLLLAAMACVAGIAIGNAIVRGFIAISHVRGLEAHTNLAVLTFAVAVSCASALAFGLAPALQSNRINPWTTLKEARMTGGPAHLFNSSRLLVIAQTALSMVLLVASGLLLRSFLNLRSVDPGFDERVLQAELDTALVSEGGMDLGPRIIERVSAISGVQAVSYSRFGPIWGSGRQCCMSPEGYSAGPNEDKNVRTQAVSPSYFRALGIPLLAGRDFTSADRKGSPQVAIINETISRYYFHGVNPVGKRFGWARLKTKDTEIIGVVKDVKFAGLKDPVQRLVYMPALQTGYGPNIVEIRAASSAGRSIDAVMVDCRAAIRQVDPSIRIATFDTVGDVVGRTLAPERLVSWLSVGLGIVALLLTSVGLYGILAYTVARRTSEFGIRMALGAGKSSILRMVMTEGLALVGIGLAAGMAVAVSLSHLVASLLFGIQPNDVVTFAAAAMSLMLVAAAACYAPARRATAVEPITALRYE